MVLFAYLLLIGQCGDRHVVTPTFEACGGTEGANTQRHEATGCVQGSAGSFIEIEGGCQCVCVCVCVCV